MPVERVHQEARVTSPFDVSEAEIDQALEACDGDSRATIRALLVGQAYLEHELSRRASSGFTRKGAKP